MKPKSNSINPSQSQILIVMKIIKMEVKNGNKQTLKSKLKSLQHLHVV